MPALSDLAKSPFVKFLFVGNSGAGKTGALTSLVQAGYKLRILDLDAGLDALTYHIKASCPDKIGNVSFMTFRDVYKSGPTGPVCLAPKAFANAVRAMDKWEDETVPAAWGSDTIFVLDSLTALGTAALAWAKQMLAGSKLAEEKRQWYQGAQDAIEHVIQTLTGPEFRSNVIIISHIDLREDPNGTVRGYASSVGAALGPKLPRYFNTMLLAETSGIGATVRRKIKTLPTGLLDLKNPAPNLISAEYPLETGLAEIFRNLKS